IFCTVEIFARPLAYCVGNSKDRSLVFVTLTWGGSVHFSPLLSNPSIRSSKRVKTYSGLVRLALFGSRITPRPIVFRSRSGYFKRAFFPGTLELDTQMLGQNTPNGGWGISAFLSSACTNA